MYPPQPRSFITPCPASFSPPVVFPQGVEYQEHWKASRGMRDLLNSQEYKSKRVAEAPFHLAVTKDVVFEELERAKSREAASRSAKWPGTR